MADQLYGFTLGLLSHRLARRVLIGRPEALERVNYQGRKLTLAGGLAAGTAASVGALLPLNLSVSNRLAASIAAGGAAIAGLIDDTRAGSSDPKGLKGHLRALYQGKITTGSLKIGIIGASALGSAALIKRDNCISRFSVIDLFLDGAIIAGSANLINLLDLRPGRALKAVGIVNALNIFIPKVVTQNGVPKTVTVGKNTATSVNATVLSGLAGGIVIGALPSDLVEETMLGDSGANALGALSGVALAIPLGRWYRLALLTGLLTLTLASERISFSQVIADNPILAKVDAWGRHSHKEARLLQRLLP